MNLIPFYQSRLNPPVSSSFFDFPPFLCLDSLQSAPKARPKCPKARPKRPQSAPKALRKCSRGPPTPPQGALKVPQRPHPEALQSVIWASELQTSKGRWRRFLKRSVSIKEANEHGADSRTSCKRIARCRPRVSCGDARAASAHIARRAPHATPMPCAPRPHASRAARCARAARAVPRRC